MFRNIKGNTWLMALGIVLLMFGISNVYREWRALTFPFSAMGEEGFIPYLDAYQQTDGILQPYYQTWYGNFGPAIPYGLQVSRGEKVDASEPPNEGGELIPESEPVVSVWNEQAEIAALQVFFPERLVIPKIELDAPIVRVRSFQLELGSKDYQQWLAPDAFEVGWHETSATLGVAGNTVLNGHHNAYGEVFGRLNELTTGDVITILSGYHKFQYIVTNTMILKEKNQPVSVRLQNARWIQPSEDERITLITCWPHESNTHRLIVVAIPYYEANGN